MAEPYIPPSQTLPPISHLDQYLDFDWDDVESLADDQGWEWDEDDGRYRDEDEALVSDDDILQLIYDKLGELESGIESARDDLVESGDLTQWEERLAEITVTTALLFFLFGIGARGNLTDNHTEHVRGRLETQFGYLRDFSEAIIAGEKSEAMIGAQGKLYAHDAELHYSQAQDFVHDKENWPFYSNLLGGCSHCNQCPEETAKGIVERGSLTPIGSRACLWRCCCNYAYYKKQDTTQRQTLEYKSYTLNRARYGWVGKDLLVLPLRHTLTTL